MKNKMWTTKDVADHFQVKPETVLLWISTGKIAGIKLGKSYRFESADVQALKDKLRLITEDRPTLVPVKLTPEK